MEGFTGGPIEAVYSQWGAPDRAEDLGNGEKVLHWTRYAMGGSCQVNILTKDNIVTTWSWKGSYCTK